MKERMRALLVDDERLARVRLRKLLEALEVQVVAEADSVERAIEVMEGVEIDAVFLDVQMPGGDGFTLLERSRVTVPVVFVTAHDEFALRAFEVNALDYLMKPVELGRLADAVARLRPEDTGGPVDHTPRASADRLCLRANGTLRIVSPDAVVAILAADDYSEVHLAAGRSVLSAVRLAEWEERLTPAGFYRAHRTALVNLARVRKLESVEGSWKVHLEGLRTPVPVGRRRLRGLRDQVE